jgi:hypothetical protein
MENDYYTTLASVRFGIPVEQVTSAQRKEAKMEVFISSYVKGECLLSGAMKVKE